MGCIGTCERKTYVPFLFIRPDANPILPYTFGVEECERRRGSHELYGYVLVLEVCHVKIDVAYRRRTYREQFLDDEGRFDRRNTPGSDQKNMCVSRNATR